MNLSKRTLILALVAIAALFAAILSARNDDAAPEDLEEEIQEEEEIHNDQPRQIYEEDLTELQKDPEPKAGNANYSGDENS